MSTGHTGSPESGLSHEEPVDAQDNRLSPSSKGAEEQRIRDDIPWGGAHRRRDGPGVPSSF